MYTIAYTSALPVPSTQIARYLPNKIVSSIIVSDCATFLSTRSNFAFVRSNLTPFFSNKQFIESYITNVNVFVRYKFFLALTESPSSQLTTTKIDNINEGLFHISFSKIINYQKKVTDNSKILKISIVIL